MIICEPLRNEEFEFTLMRMYINERIQKNIQTAK